MNSDNNPRLLAFEVLSRVEEGAYSDLALAAALSRRKNLDRRDRGLVTELVYGVLRCRGRLDFALSLLCKQPLGKIQIPLRQILRLGAYQILHLDRVPVRAAVHETVELTHRLRFSRASGLVNGVLRALAREKESLPWPDSQQQPLEALVHRFSLPLWLAENLLLQLGKSETLSFGEESLLQAPFSLRVNTLKNDRETLIAELHSRGIEVATASFAPEGLRVVGHAEMDALIPGLHSGKYMIQDEASMLISHLLSARKGDRILDACAAPGGKTTHLAALTTNGSEILALDLYEKRLRLVREGSEKMGCRRIETRVCDLTKPPSFPKDVFFDRVLVDAPCSGLGVLRRNPEIRWRRGPADIEELARIQGRILHNVASLVRPGGILLYSVCTLTPEETIGVTGNFLRGHPEFQRTDLRSLFPPAWKGLFDEKGNFCTWPHRQGRMDAFFAVRFQRK